MERGHRLTPHSRIGPLPRPLVARGGCKGVNSGDNPAPAKSDDPRYALKPVRVRECQNVIRKSGEYNK
jgi:hypothetical protein